MRLSFPLLFTTVLLFFDGLIIAQPNVVHIQGKVKCSQNEQGSSKGATPVIVFPEFNPSLATQTASSPTGFYKFSTGLIEDDLLDKTLKLTLITKCHPCEAISQNVFITEGRLMKDGGGKGHVVMQNWSLNKLCDSVEMRKKHLDSVFLELRKIKAVNINKIRNSSLIAGSPALMNFLQTGVVAGATAGISNIRYQAWSLSVGDIRYGEFLQAGVMYFTSNKGFNFSPGRDLSEAMIWNPSAVAFGRKASHFSISTNWKNNAKLTAFKQVNRNWSFGFSGIASMQDEFREVTFNDGNLNSRIEDSIELRLMEVQVSASVVYKFNRNWSSSLSLKYLHQQFDKPDSLICDDNGAGTFEGLSENKQLLEFDFSLSYKPTHNLQIGVSTMNLAQSKLFADTYTPLQSTIHVKRLRSLGLGATYKYNRWHFGTDVLLSSNGLYDIAVGINFIPFNNALFSGGMAIKQMSPSLAFSYGHFKLAYINDNGWFVNETTKPSFSLANGHLYSGFFWDFGKRK